MHSLSKGRIRKLGLELVLIDTPKAPYQYWPRHRHQLAQLCFSCSKWQGQLHLERTGSRDSQIQPSHSTRADWCSRVPQGWVKRPPACFGGLGSTGLGLRSLHCPSATGWMLPESLQELTSKQWHTLRRTWWLSTLGTLSLAVFVLQPPWAVLGSISGACWKLLSFPCWSEQVGKWYKEQSPSSNMAFMANKNRAKGESVVGDRGEPKDRWPHVLPQGRETEDSTRPPEFTREASAPLPHGWSEPRGEGASPTPTRMFNFPNILSCLLIQFLVYVVMCQLQKQCLCDQHQTQRFITRFSSK